MVIKNTLSNDRKSHIKPLLKLKNHGLKLLNLSILGILTTACQFDANLSGDITSTDPATGTGDTSSYETILSGSVGDGPIISSQIKLEDANNLVINNGLSDGSSSYNIGIPVGSSYPVLVSARGGTDIVTGSQPDFTLVSVATDSSADTVNINPFSTIIVKTAQAMPGGLTPVNLTLARQYVADQLSFGLDSKYVPDPITTPIDSDNIAVIVKASEALGETIRRTRSTLLVSGSDLTGDQIVDAMAADMIDGKLDGRGATGVSPRIAAVANVVSGQVLAEALTNRLKVGGTDATALMDTAISLTLPGATRTTADVVITREAITQAQIATVATSMHSPGSDLTALTMVLAGLPGDSLAADVTAALPADPGGIFNVAVSQVALSSGSEHEAVNASVRTGNTIPAPVPSISAFAFSSPTYSVSESDGSLDVTINRSGDTSGTAIVEWRTRTFNGYGTADWSTDYGTIDPTQLAFADGEVSKVVSVSINSDNVAEDNETFSLLLQDQNGNVTSQSLVTIVDSTTVFEPVPAPEPAPAPTPSVADYYVSPNGNDANNGSSASAPFKTIQKAINAARAGDLIYVRGGVYRLTSRISITKSGSSGNLIRLFAYPGENPVIDGSNVTTDQANIYFYNASYWHLKGFEVKDSAADGIRLKGSSNHNIIEAMNVHGSGRIGQYKGNGISVWDTSGYNLILNCDSHHNVDLQGPARLGNADGYHLGPSGQGNVLMGNRAWKNSDDGYDLFNGSPTTLVDNWAWENGYDDNYNALGDGNGFKLGGGDAARGGHVVVRNVSWKNKAKGYTENGLPGGPSTVVSNTSFNNRGNGYKFNIEPHTLRNNLEYGSSGNNVGGADDQYNSWNMSPAVSSSTFLSTNDTIAKGARQADGSLPESDFLKLAPGSHVIDAGIVPSGVSATYLTPDGRPDLGAFESGM